MPNEDNEDNAENCPRLARKKISASSPRAANPGCSDNEKSANHSARRAGTAFPRGARYLPGVTVKHADMQAFQVLKPWSNLQRSD